MQRAGVDRRKGIIFEIIAGVLLLVLIAIDQITKCHFSKNYYYGERTAVIDGFFYFTYTVNTGAAWSFLAEYSWAQTFFKILTIVALVMFVAFYVYAFKKGYKWLKISIVLVVAGTIGNFIDRVAFDGVIDFLSFVFGSYHFPVFNIADCCLVVGVIMVIVHYLFLDEGRLIKLKDKDGKKEFSDK